LLAPGESRKVSFMMLPTSMAGTGEQTKLIEFRFSDASSLSVPVTATIITRGEAQQVTVVPSSLQLDLTGAKVGVRLSETVRVTHEPAKGKLRMAAKEGWLAVETDSSNETGTTLTVSITPEARLLGELSELKSVTGTVTVAVDEKAPPVELIVRLFVKDFAEVRPNLIRVRRGESIMPAQVVVRPLGHMAKKLVVARAWADAEDVAVDQTDESDGSVSIRVKLGAKALAGLHRVKCLVRSDSGTESILSFMIDCE